MNQNHWDVLLDKDQVFFLRKHNFNQLCVFLEDLGSFSSCFSSSYKVNFLVIVEDRKGGGPSVQGMEGGKYLLSAYLQVLIQLRCLCRREREIEGQKENSGMVCAHEKYFVLSLLVSISGKYLIC